MNGLYAIAFRIAVTRSEGKEATMEVSLILEVSVKCASSESNIRHYTSRGLWSKSTERKL